MDIKSVLDERVIDLRMKAKDKKEAITYLEKQTAQTVPDRYRKCG